MRYAKFIIAIMVLLPVAFTVTGEEAKQGAATVAPVAQPADHDHGAMKEKRFIAVIGADGVQRVEVVGGDYYFDPNYIIVKVNVPVELTIKKADGYTPHNMVVAAPDAGINFSVDLGKEPKVVKFTPTMAGKYEMLCDKKLLFFKSHKERGMDGMIEAVP